MKYFLALTLVLTSLIASSQKIKTSEFDKFIKAYRIEAGRVVFKMNMSGFFIVTLRSVDSTIFIDVDEASYIKDGVGEGQNFIFLLDNDSTITVAAKESLLTHKHESGPRISNLEYYTKISDLLQLQRSIVKSVRIYGLSGYKDIDIKEGDSKDLSKMCEIFLAEYNQKVLKQP